MIDFNPYHRKTEFKRTGNPLYAWDMILECRKENKIFPEWVMEYLEDVAEELVNISPSKNRMSEKIRDALGFKGKPFGDYQRFLNVRDRKSESEFMWTVYQWIEERLEPGVTKQVVFEKAGKHFFGEDIEVDNHWRTAQGVYLKMKKIIETVEAETER